MPDKTAGRFLEQKRRERGITVRGMAALLDCVPAVVADVEKGRRYPLDYARMEDWANKLNLSWEDRHTMYDLAGECRDELAADLPDYIKARQFVVDTIRLAQDLGATAEDWERFAVYLEFRKGAKASPQ